MAGEPLPIVCANNVNEAHPVHLFRGTALTLTVMVSASAPPSLLAVPEEVSFGGVVVGDQETIELRLTSLGAAGGKAISVMDLGIIGKHAVLFDAEGDEHLEIPYGTDAVVSVWFAPDSTGPKSARLTIEHTGSNQQLVLPLSG